MQDKREKMADEGLGRFMIAVSVVMFVLVVFLPHVNNGTRATGVAICVSGVLMGLSKVTAAKKWKEKYGEPTPEELMEIKKNHSISFFRLTVLIVVTIVGFVLLFLGIVFLLHYLFHI